MNLSSQWPCILALLVLLLASAVPDAQGAGSDHAEAMRVRRLVIANPLAPLPPEAECIVLPVSRAFDQGSTELCWVYATLSGLETRARVVQHRPGTRLHQAGPSQAAPSQTALSQAGPSQAGPSQAGPSQPASSWDDPTGVELSRRALQVATIRDRFLRIIHRAIPYTGERGVAVDAMQLVAARGLVAFSDFTDVLDPYGSFDIAGAVAAAVGEPAKVAALEQGLSTVYGVPPTTTHHQGQPVSPAALAAAVVAGQVWESLAPTSSGAEGYRQHPDPDARAGTLAYFLPRERIAPRIHDALKAGHPVEITLGGHCLLLYGASYDAAANPRLYYIKDSYPGYFYKADPGRMMANLVEISTARF